MKRIRSGATTSPTGVYISSTSASHWRFEENVDWVEPFCADKITTKNWDGRFYRLRRGSKLRVWAVQLFFFEGFTITFDGKRYDGNYSQWLILDGQDKYIMSKKIFRKTFYFCHH